MEMYPLAAVDFSQQQGGSEARGKKATYTRVYIPITIHYTHGSEQQAAPQG